MPLDIPPHLLAGFERLVAKARSDLEELGIDTSRLLPGQMLRMARDERNKFKQCIAGKESRKTPVKKGKPTNEK